MVQYTILGPLNSTCAVIYVLTFGSVEGKSLGASSTSTIEFNKTRVLVGIN